MDALRLDHLVLDYPGRPGVLRDVSLRLPPGALLVLQGRSGSGKSSLLHIAAGLQAPTKGTVTILDEELPAKDAVRRAQLRGQHVGMVLQHLHLLAELTMADNVALPLRLAGWPRARQRTRATELLAQFGLQDLAQRRPGQCSGGEQQRAAIARAMALGPALLVVDEPTSALDAANAATVVAALRTASRAGAAVLVASHDDLLARAGPRLRIRDGRLEAAK
ncbi:MAG: ABC transporter ATP-binding protein [Thermoplasmatota archaeon]